MLVIIGLLMQALPLEGGKITYYTRVILKRITSWQYLFCELKIFMWLILHTHPKTYAFI